jgi:ankyrin repeat protein
MIKKNLIKKLLNKQTFTEDDFLKALLNPKFIIEEIEEKFNKDFNLNKQNDEGETYLHLCAQKGNLDASSWLLKNGLDIEARTKTGETPLFYAALSDKTPITRFFIAQGANTEHLNTFKRTALQEVLIADKKTSSLLFEHTKNLNNADSHGNNIVFDAIANGNPGLINEVINNKEIDINHVNNDGNTILHKDVVIKNNALAMRLMEAGANPTILDKKGKNFLFYAIAKGIENADIIDKAIELGCNINTKDSDDKTILMYSMHNYIKAETKEEKESHLEMLKKLIQKGSNIEEIDKNGENILFNAVRNLDETLIELFLSTNKINPNHQNIHGETVLTDSCLHGMKAAKYVKRLLKEGASANIQDNLGSSIIENL